MVSGVSGCALAPAASRLAMMVGRAGVPNAAMRCKQHYQGLSQASSQSRDYRDTFPAGSWLSRHDP